MKGNVLTIQDYKMGNPQTQTFTYDEVYRLESVRASGGQSGAGDYAQENYAYDAATGNLSSKAGVNYTYDGAATNMLHWAINWINLWL